MYLNWMSTASFITLNKRGVKNVFQLHYLQYKIDTASVYKALCFPALSNQPFGRNNKVVSIEHLKQKLSLDNNLHRCYNDVNKSKTVLFSLCRHA